MRTRLAADGHRFGGLIETGRHQHGRFPEQTSRSRKRESDQDHERYPNRESLPSDPRRATRRTFLRGVGVSMALPWLESVPVWGARRWRATCRCPVPSGSPPFHGMRRQPDEWWEARGVDGAWAVPGAAGPAEGQVERRSTAYSTRTPPASASTRGRPATSSQAGRFRRGPS